MHNIIWRIAWFVIIITLPVFTSAQFRYSTNDPVIKNYTITSKFLKEDRKISIYKPEVLPEYAES